MAFIINSWYNSLAALLVLTFGEVLPSSIFSGTSVTDYIHSLSLIYLYIHIGPNQLKLAALLSPVVKILLVIFYVVARPIGLCLDWWLGHHKENEVPFNAKDLYTLLSLSAAGKHENTDRMSTSHAGTDLSEALLLSSRAPSILSEHQLSAYLDDDAVTIAQGAILSSKRTVESILIREFYSVLASATITWDFLHVIGECGFSRICIIDDNHSQIHSSSSPPKIRYFVVKEILANIKYYIENQRCVGDLPAYDMYYFRPLDSILLALNQFQSGESRIGVVTTTGYPDGTVRGYFSMEDVVEAIIQEEIADEKDSRQCAAKVIAAMRNTKRSVSSTGGVWNKKSVGTKWDNDAVVD